MKREPSQMRLCLYDRVRVYEFKDGHIWTYREIKRHEVPGTCDKCRFLDDSQPTPNADYAGRCGHPEHRPRVWFGKGCTCKDWKGRDDAGC